MPREGVCFQGSALGVDVVAAIFDVSGGSEVGVQQCVGRDLLEGGQINGLIRSGEFLRKV